MIACREGLIFSQNRLTARVGAQVGLPVFGALMERLGVCSAGEISANPSSLIGSFEARLADLTRAFTIFPLAGYECPTPHIIKSVQSKAGEILFRPTSNCTLVADPTGCRITANCLREVFTRGTAKSAVAQVSMSAIGKTGSTNAAKDCWFVGADEKYTCAVWIGCDKPTPLAGGSGGKFALPLWVKIMQRKGGSISAR
jgi:membrane peptidoglycan carboxypeptidase